MKPEVFFLASGMSKNQQRFCLFYPAQGPDVQGLVLYIHPFAEEMNKARRMAALQSRSFARAGYAVLQIDLLGCGDSAGDFGDATWQHWVNDVVLGYHWLRARHAAQGAPAELAPLWLWGLRAGCLLAAQAAQQLAEPVNYLFWNAPASGKLLLQQFLRLKVAGDMLSGNARGVMDGLRKNLALGCAVEIAGDQLSSELALGLEASTLLPPALKTPPSRMEWLDVATHGDASMSPVSRASIEAWHQTGYRIRSQRVCGPAFWQSGEIEEVPALIDASTTAISGALEADSPLREAA